jgi:hypothetical protein
MRPEFETLVALGRIPVDAQLDEQTARRFTEAIDGLSSPPTAEEAAALLDILPIDESTSFGLAWSLVHVIESSPDWPLGSALNDRSWWVTTLRQRSDAD